MTGAQAIDVFLIGAVALAALTGWGSGVIIAVCSVLGVVAGSIVGIVGIPHVVSTSMSASSRLFASLGILLVLVMLGQVLGAMVGRALRRRVVSQPGARIDRAMGALFQPITVIVVAWMVAIPLTAQLHNPLGAAVRGSTFLSVVDRNLPDAVKALPYSIAERLNDSAVPEIVGPFTAEPSQEVPAPVDSAADAAVIERVQGSVLKVRSQASQCLRSLEGSSFVVAQERVVTNAHVVAGAERVQVETPAGILDASVVLFNPDRDIAVLAVPGLDAPILPWRDAPLDMEDPAIVVGFPGDGPYVGQSVRVRQMVQLRGPDIYRSRTVTREVYSLRGAIREGNSGGPLLNGSGETVGLIFGQSLTDAETGYALTYGEIGEDVAAGIAAHSPVGTGECVLTR